jgi:hypothetical protein
MEGGYDFALNNESTLAPFTAIAGDSYHQPTYSESPSSNDANYAAAFAANSIGIVHTELELRFGQYLAPQDSYSISIDAMTGWEYELDDNPFVNAALQRQPGTSYFLHGTTPAKNMALLGLGRSLPNRSRHHRGRTDRRPIGCRHYNSIRNSRPDIS